MIDVDWLYCMNEANCSFSHYHSYLEASFALNVLFGSVWRFIQGHILKSKLNSQMRMELKMNWINPEALTGDLEASLAKIGNMRDGSDLWVRVVTYTGRFLCVILAAIIIPLLLLLDGNEEVSFWAMSVFFLVPASMVILTCLIHYGWAWILYMRIKWVFWRARKALDRKLKKAKVAAAGRVEEREDRLDATTS